MDDLKYSLRRLGARPGATLASVITLACAIGAAAATWSLLSAVLLKPLPVSEPERLFVLGEARKAGVPYGAFTYPYLSHVRESGVFEAVAAHWTSPMSLLVSTGDIAVQTRVSFVSHDYFDVLGVNIPLGRSFTADDDRRGTTPVAIVTDAYWRTALNASPSVLGRTLTVSGTAVTIVGVSASGYRGLDLASSPGVIFPFHVIGDIGHEHINYFAEPSEPGRRRNSPTAGVGLVGKLRPGTAPGQAAARLNGLGFPPAVVAGRPTPPGVTGPEYALTNINTAAIPVAARDGMRQFALLLGMTVGLILLIGAGTVGMLLLVRTEARRAEFATCLALGASRVRLARGIAVEGLLLAASGGLFALPFAWWMFQAAAAFQLPGAVSIERLDLTLDRTVVGTVLAAGLLITLIITALAGVFGFGAGTGDVLRARGGATPRLARRRTRTALVVVQVAGALVLVSGAVLLTRSILEALTVNPGFDAGRLVTTNITLAPHGYSEPRATAFFDELGVRLRSNPAIERMAFSMQAGAMGAGGRLVIDGEPRTFPSAVWETVVDPHYFDTMGLRPVAGRAFDDRDTSPRVAVVSESFGRMMSHGGNPIGQRITMGHSRAGEQPDVMEVVGVVPDVVTNVNVLEPLVMYFPLAQHTGGTYRTLTVRTASRPVDGQSDVLSAIRALDPAVQPSPPLTMRARLAQQMSAQHFGASVMGALGTLAVLLTALGTYVLAESMAVLRMREMGIRAALGATRPQLAWLVLAETARLVGGGLAVGLFLAWLGTGTIQSFLFNVQPLDPLTLGAVAGTISLLALVVSVRPAARAARADLAAVLKAE